MNITAPIEIYSPHRLLGAFRLILALLLSLFYLADQRLWPLDPRLSLAFQIFLAIYLVFLLVSTLLWRYARWRQPLALLVSALLDLLLLTILCFFTGGDNSQLSYLILVSLLVHGALLTRSSGLLLVLAGLFCSLTLWISERWIELADADWAINDLMDRGMARIFVQTIVALLALALVHRLSERIKQSEVLLETQSKYLAEAAHLHQTIIQQVQTGMIVIDRLQHILLINSVAQAWLEVDEVPHNAPLQTISDALNQRLSRWLSMGLVDNNFLIMPNDLKLHVQFSRLQDAAGHNILIILDDVEQAQRRSQQAKLAALGRLTAGIAHEVRNPLASINQAAQLLQEQLLQQNANTRLTQLITTNVSRANRIINDVLDMARRKQPETCVFELQPWLGMLCKEFVQAYPHMQQAIHVSFAIDFPRIGFDPSQLRQIVWNLMVNAVLHGSAVERSLQIWLVAGCVDDESWLEISDNGVGFAKEQRSHLFEPFFSTHHQGTGLGLYMAKELCQANQGELVFQEGRTLGACFRIVFPKILSEPEQYHIPMTSSDSIASEALAPIKNLEGIKP